MWVASEFDGIPGAISASDGDERALDSAFEQLYREYCHEVARWGRAMGGLDADLEDLSQEVFIVVRRKLEGFDGRNPAGWLYRITQRTVRDYRRRTWFRRMVARHWLPDDDLVDAGQSPREQVERREAERLLTGVLDRMTNARRTAFVLFEIEGYRGEEIAELEGIPLNTVYTRLHHARKDFVRMVAHLNRGQQR